MPHTPEQARSRYLRRNAEAAKTCPDCGAQISYPSTHCSTHANRRTSTYRKPRSDGWTRDEALAALKAWAKAHDGEPPVFGGPVSGLTPRIPSPRTVRRLFGSWRDGIAEAGMVPRDKGQNRQAMESKPRGNT